MPWLLHQRTISCLPVTLPIFPHNLINSTVGKGIGSKCHVAQNQSSPPMRQNRSLIIDDSGGGRERKLEEEAKNGVSSLKDTGKEALDKAKEAVESANERIAK